MKKMVVVGMGYVGIPVAALFADTGAFRVIGIQRRSERSGWKIDLLNQGLSPFPNTEPGIADLIRRVVLEQATFRVTDDYDTIRESDYILIDVQTPVEDNHEPQYESLKEVTNQVGRLMRRGVLVCIESTVAPGTTRNIVQPILENVSRMEAGKDFHLAFSYERVMVGRLLYNIQNYSRVIGGLTEECTRRAVDLYCHIVKAPVVSTDCLTAEVAKTVENAYRDVNIAFANEVALMCESLGVNVYEVRELVNNLPNDPSNPAANPVRNMHLPGAGVGGHCLPKDSWLLKYGVDHYGKFPVESKVLIGSREVNNFMPIHIADLVFKNLAELKIDVVNEKVAVLGYAFLKDSDDVRNTPAKPLIENLYKRGVKHIVIHDPFVKDNNICNNLFDTIKNASCACIVTDHSEYEIFNSNIDLIASLMKNCVIIDGRNVIKNIKEKERVHIVKIGT